MRLSSASVRVLRTFLENPTEEHYGFGLMRTTGVKAGSLYPILGRLEQAGWIDGFDELIDEHLEGRPRRRLYRLTSLGATEATQAVSLFYSELGIPVTLVPGLGLA